MSQNQWKPIISTNNTLIAALETKEGNDGDILFMGINVENFLGKPAKISPDLKEYSVETSSSIIGMIYVAQSDSGKLTIKHNIPVFRHSKSDGEFYYSLFPVNMTDIEGNATTSYERNIMDTSSLQQLLQRFVTVLEEVNIGTNVQIKSLDDFNNDNLVEASSKFWTTPPPPTGPDGLPVTSFVHGSLPPGSPALSPDASGVPPPPPPIGPDGNVIPPPPTGPDGLPITSFAPSGTPVGTPITATPVTLEEQKTAEANAKISQHIDSHGIYWNPVSTTSSAKLQEATRGGGFSAFIKPLQKTFMPLQMKLQKKPAGDTLYVHHLFGIFTDDPSIVSDNKSLPGLAQKLKLGGAKPLKQSGLPSYIVKAVKVTKDGDDKLVADESDIKYFTTKTDDIDVVNKQLYTLYEIIGINSNQQELKSRFSKKQEMYTRFNEFIKLYKQCDSEDEDCTARLTGVSNDILEFLGKKPNKPAEKLNPIDVRLIFITIGNYMLINSIFSPNYNGALNISDVLSLASDITKTAQTQPFRNPKVNGLISGGSDATAELPRIIFSRNQKRRIEKKGLNLELIKKMYYNHILTEADIDNLKNSKVLSDATKSEIVRRINSHLSHAETPDIEIQSAIPTFDNVNTETTARKPKVTTYKKRSDLTLPSLSKTRKTMRGGNEMFGNTFDEPAAAAPPPPPAPPAADTAADAAKPAADAAKPATDAAKPATDAAPKPDEAAEKAAKEAQEAEKAAKKAETRDKYDEAKEKQSKNEGKLSKAKKDIADYKSQLKDKNLDPDSPKAKELQEKLIGAEKAEKGLTDNLKRLKKETDDARIEATRSGARKKSFKDMFRSDKTSAEIQEAKDKAAQDKKITDPQEAEKAAKKEAAKGKYKDAKEAEAKAQQTLKQKQSDIKNLQKDIRGLPEGSAERNAKMRELKEARKAEEGLAADAKTASSKTQDARIDATRSGARKSTLKDMFRTGSTSEEKKAAAEARVAAEKKVADKKKTVDALKAKLKDGTASPDEIKELNKEQKELDSARKERSAARDKDAKAKGWGSRTVRAFGRIGKAMSLKRKSGTMTMTDRLMGRTVEESNRARASRALKKNEAEIKSTQNEINKALKKDPNADVSALKSKQEALKAKTGTLEKARSEAKTASDASRKEINDAAAAKKEEAAAKKQEAADAKKAAAEAKKTAAAEKKAAAAAEKKAAPPTDAKKAAPPADAKKAAPPADGKAPPADAKKAAAPADGKAPPADAKKAAAPADAKKPAAPAAGPPKKSAAAAAASRIQAAFRGRSKGARAAAPAAAAAAPGMPPMPGMPGKPCRDECLTNVIKSAQEATENMAGRTPVERRDMRALMFAFLSAAAGTGITAADVGAMAHEQKTSMAPASGGSRGKNKRTLKKKRVKKVKPMKTVRRRPRRKSKGIHKLE